MPAPYPAESHDLTERLLRELTEERTLLRDALRHSQEEVSQLRDVVTQLLLRAEQPRLVAAPTPAPAPAPLPRRRFLAAGLAAAAVGGLAVAGRSLSGAQAAAPTTINYQGRLTDASGAPLNDSYNMTFTLWSASTGGTNQWQEVRNGANAVQVNNGLFSVFLGSVTAIPATILANPLWLGVQVGSDPEMSPREQLGTVPYARSADAITGYNISTTGGANTIPVLDGSGRMPANTVATASIVDSSVINFTYLQMGNNVTPNFTTTSTSFVTIPNISLSLTTTGKPVLLMAGYDIYVNTSGGFTCHDFAVDGARLSATAYGCGQLNITIANRTFHHSMFAFAQPAAGAHTFTLQMFTTTGTLLTDWNSFTSYFAALELKK